jgi:hypothetical protein
MESPQVRVQVRVQGHWCLPIYILFFHSVINMLVPIFQDRGTIPCSQTTLSISRELYVICCLQFLNFVLLQFIDSILMMSCFPLGRRHACCFCCFKGDVYFLSLASFPQIFPLFDTYHCVKWLQSKTFEQIIGDFL